MTIGTVIVFTNRQNSQYTGELANCSRQVGKRLCRFGQSTQPQMCGCCVRGHVWSTAPGVESSRPMPRCGESLACITETRSKVKTKLRLRRLKGAEESREVFEPRSDKPCCFRGQPPQFDDLTYAHLEDEHGFCANVSVRVRVVRKWFMGTFFSKHTANMTAIATCLPCP